MTQPIIDAEHVNECLKVIASIKEVPNPAYKKAMRDRKAFSPQPGSIRQTNQLPAASLSEVIQQRENRYTLEVLNKISEVCDCCPDCSDCSLAIEIRAADMCERVKRNLVYIGVIEK
jgi:hypothetical protein